jgi:phage-related protein
VESVKFGDGYEQRVSLGINTRPRKWSLTFTLDTAAVLDFLETANGVDSFNWTDPFGVSGKYICRNWKTEHKGGRIHTLSADFEQVFDL